MKKDDVDTINEQITFFREDYIPLAARKAVQFDRLVRELSGLEDDRIGPMTNLWLDELDVAALRQQLLPKAKLALEHYEEILNKASTVAVVMEAYMASRDQVNIEEISNTLMASIDCGRPQEDDSIESNQFTPSEMRMTKREAQKVLSPDRFKAWKKEIRASKGASNNDEEDDA